MAIELDRKEVGDITVLGISGKLTLGEGVRSLKSAIAEELANNRKKIILDLGSVKHIDSTGIECLVSELANVSQKNGKLKLANLTKKVKDLLVITKLYTPFDVHPDADSGVKSFHEVCQTPDAPCPPGMA